MERTIFKFIWKVKKRKQNSKNKNEKTPKKSNKKQNNKTNKQTKNLKLNNKRMAGGITISDLKLYIIAIVMNTSCVTLLLQIQPR
jgi:sortase (surface protein transpeptidase)